MRCKHAVIISIIGLLHLAAPCGADYQGSQAYNKSQMLHESVNAATGTFDFSYPIISTQGRRSTFKLNLTYRFNKAGMLGLPQGWQLDVDFINDRFVNIHGQQWLIDPLWHDEALFASGLKYFNQHGTLFKDAGVSKEVPEHKGIFFRYCTKHKDGSINYFSHQGLLVLKQDRFNNTIKFDYETPVDSLTSAKIKTITDNYGNVYQFSYAPNELIIHYPDHRTTHIYHDDKGVIKIINPLNQEIIFSYLTQFNRTLLRTIETPSGLLTQLSYDAINYKEGSKTKAMPVITQVKKVDLSTHKPLRETHYTYSKDNNFTGYPVYGLSNDGDNLMESNNQGFRYWVQIAKSDLDEKEPKQHTQIFYYNYLHLPTEVLTQKSGKNYLKTAYEYAISPFKYSRSTNYDKPSTVTQYLWSDVHNIYIPTDKKTHRYDAFGNTLQAEHFIFDRLHWQWQPISTEQKKYFTDAYSLIAESTHIDGISGLRLQKKYHLAKNKKTHAQFNSQYKKDHNSQWAPWRQTNFTHDQSGRLTYQATEWRASNQPGIQKTWFKKTYEIDEKTAELTITKESALGATTTALLDTKNGNKLAEITPLGEQWHYKYDPLGRQTQLTNPLGHIASKTYQDFQRSKINSVTEITPLNDQTRSQFDALHQLSSHEDWYENLWRPLTTYHYNGWGKILKKTNIFGLSAFIQYDESERQISHIDPYGNITKTDYNDLLLTTTTYRNNKKMHEKLTEPWTLTTKERYFPVFDNPYDEQTSYVENLTLKNGLGKITHKENSLVHRYTLEKTDTVTKKYTYDGSLNPTEEHVEGFDGMTHCKSKNYDLFNNPVNLKKSQKINNAWQSNEGEHFTFDEDNRLVRVDVTNNSDKPLSTTRYEYNKNGKRIKTTLPNGNAIYYQYDPRNLLTQSTWLREKKAFTVYREYDADKRLKKACDSKGNSLHFKHTSNGLISAITYPDNQLLRYTYDNKNRIESLTDYSGLTQQYIYKSTDLGKISEINFNNNRIIFHYGVDHNGLKGQLLQRDTHTEKDGLTENFFIYGATGILANSSIANHQSGSIYNVSYTSNPRKQLITQKTHAHLAHLTAENTEFIYQYDAMNRLVNESLQHDHGKYDISYLYDANNNILTETHRDNDQQYTHHYTYNGADQLIQSYDAHEEKTITLSYNLNGDLINDGSGTEFHYDDKSFLLSSNKDMQSVSYDYSPDGLMHSRQSTDLTQYFYFDQTHNIISQKNNHQWLDLIRFNRQILAGLYDKKVEQLFALHNSTGATLTSGDSLQTQLYTGYGIPLKPNTTTMTGEYGWNQALSDPTNQLIYLKKRFYHPQIKRFLTKDNTLVDNRYAYAKGNPIFFHDPTGHSAALNYGLGSGVTALGIVGALFAIPTGGASLTLSAGAGIAAGVTSALSGIALMGSQGALDSGNKQAAKALQYTSIGLGVAALVSAGISIAPAASQLIASSSSFSSSTPSVEGIYQVTHDSWSSFNTYMPARALRTSEYLNSLNPEFAGSTTRSGFTIYSEPASSSSSYASSPASFNGTVDEINNISPLSAPPSSAQNSPLSSELSSAPNSVSAIRAHPPEILNASELRLPFNQQTPVTQLEDDVFAPTTTVTSSADESTLSIRNIVGDTQGIYNLFFR